MGRGSRDASVISRKRNSSVFEEEAESTKWAQLLYFVHSKNYARLETFLVANLYEVNTMDIICNSSLVMKSKSGDLLEGYFKDRSLFMAPIHLAIARNDAEAFDVLCNFGAILDLPLKSGHLSRGLFLRPIQLAIVLQNNDLVKLLIEKKADVNLMDGEGFSSLDFAFIYGNNEAANLLYAIEAKPATYRNRTKLTLCQRIVDLSLKSNFELILFMLRIGYDLGKEMGEYVRVLQTVDLDNEMVITLIKTLLALGLSYETRFGPHNDTLLHLVAKRQSLVLVKLFLKKGIHPNVVNDLSQTPLHLAVEGEKDEKSVVIIAELIRSGAIIDFEDNEGQTATMRAIRRGRGREALITTLIEAGCGLKGDAQGLSLLHLYCSTHRIIDKGLLDTFLYHGSDINEETEKGWTPLHFFIHSMEKIGADREPFDSVHLLLSRYANPLATTNYGDTCLSMAIIKRFPGLAIHLIRSVTELKGNQETERLVNIVTEEGYSPLHLATMSPISVGLVSHLVQNGAQINVRDKEGYSALHLVITNGLKGSLLNLLYSKRSMEQANGENSQEVGSCCRRDDMFKYLVSQKETNIECVSKGGTLLAYSLRFAEYRMAEILVRRGANILGAGIKDIERLDIGFSSVFQLMHPLRCVFSQPIVDHLSKLCDKTRELLELEFESNDLRDSLLSKEVALFKDWLEIDLRQHLDRIAVLEETVSPDHLISYFSS